jgi:pyruvate, water dikinase
MEEIKGSYVTKKVVGGNAIVSPAKYSKLDSNTVLVLERADITWFPLIKQAAGVIIEEGTLLGHFSQMLREMNLPSLIGAENATKILLNGQKVTMFPSEEDTNLGFVVDGHGGLYNPHQEDVKGLPRTVTNIYPLCSFKRRMAELKGYPISGVGLMRSEFLNCFMFGVHPQAFVDYCNGHLEDDTARRTIESMLQGLYGGEISDPREFYVRSIAAAIADVASLMPGKRINYRLADLRSDDAANLVGGEAYEPEEHNPMMGYRGTTKLINEKYRAALRLEFDIIKAVLEDPSIDLHILTPFCRTCEDGEKLVGLARTYGLKQPQIGMMVEMPSNVVMASEFADVFDYFLIGPMDLTQSTYMSDREAHSMRKYCDINQEGPRRMVETMLRYLDGRNKEVWVGEYELFSGLPRYLDVISNNTLHLVCLPDRLAETIRKVHDLESMLGLI